jgi:hypothetical protein
VYIDPTTDVTFRRNINIELQRAAQPITMQEFKAITIKQFQTIKDFKESSAGATTLSGLPAYRVLWQGEVPGSPSVLRFLSVWTVLRGQAWLVTYTSDPDRFGQALGAVNRVIHSIQLP